ncbi:hypothetical protein AX17_004399 [Amanita inopinata Kibby_2008]|nr:hypothetical protein AX17_004399 [Amanita inopinata Kibby_2008]
MFTLPIFASLAFVALSGAQSSNGMLQIEAIEAHFQQSHIVPDLLSSFDPSALLSLTYAGVGDLTPGQLLTKEQVAVVPKIKVTPANDTIKLTNTYTLAMVDADIVGANLSKGVTRHWLVNGVTVADNQVSNTSATGITAYAGPWPAAGSGPHRYVVLLYEQPPNFKPPADLSQPVAGVSVFDLNGYAKASGLGPIIAGTYMTVEEGQATVTVPATSAVVSSTLAANGGVPSETGGTSAGSSGKNGAAGGRGGRGWVGLAVMVGMVVVT